jgi:hypothetical protein
MLLNSGVDTSAYHQMEPLAYGIVETLLDDVSKKMAASNLTRKYSRGGGQKASGGSRVVKTSSASNSPRNATMISRRKTLMTDSPYRRRPMMVDQGGMASNTICDGLQATSRSNRPVSWHPSSHMTPQAPYQTSSYTIPRVELNGSFNSYELPPTPAVFSGYTSPASAFSPLSQPFSNDQQQFQYTDDTFFFPTVACDYTNSSLYTPYQTSSPIPQQMDDQNYAPITSSVDQSMYSHFGWSSFTTNGFDNATAPPTPEDFLPIQHPDPSLSTDEAIPYHPLDDSESTGEELIGMGLYDTPEKAPPSDPHLDNYRALMMTQLLGPAYRKQEPTGKGLKLEETWNPPTSDDGEEGEDAEDDEDAEGSTVDDTPAEIPNTSATNGGTVMPNDHGIIDASNQYQHYRTNGWL